MAPIPRQKKDKKAMAPIPKPVNEDPPAASDSDEEETESSDSEPQPSQSKKPAAPLQKPESEKEESESESESESDSDSEDGSDSDSKIVKPTASKPIEDSLTKSSNAKAKAAPATPVSKLTAGKRAAAGETEQSKDAKKPRKEGGSGENTEDTKKQRLWSDDDEIALLDGMIEFSEKRRVDPTRDLAAFHDFIKKSLSIEVAQSQLKDKIGRLRRKFAKFSKANEDEDKSFPRVHEREVFDLSKKIWGTNKRQAEAEPSNRKAKDGDSSSKYLGQGNNRMEMDGMGIEDIGKFVATKGLDYVQGSKRGELEKMWKEVHIDSLELLAKRSRLMHDQAKLMVKAMKD